jgi:hypothetical protein
MINRSKILTKAWSEYRSQISRRDDRSFNRALFASILRNQWLCAKMQAAEAAKVAAPVSPVETRAVQIRTELRNMEFADFMDWGRRDALFVELSRLGV